MDRALPRLRPARAPRGLACLLRLVARRRGVRRATATAALPSRLARDVGLLERPERPVASALAHRLF